MNLECWIYVTRKGCDTPEAAISVVRDLGARLKAWHQAGLLAGYQAIALTGPDDFDERDIDPELVESVTNGELPAVYVNLTYDLDGKRPSAAELDALVSTVGLVHVLTDSSSDE